MAEPDQKPDPSPSRPPRRRRRRIALAGLTLAILLVGLVLLAPTLLSTAPGRALAVSIINTRIDGQLEVSGWSLGWRSGTRIDALRLLNRADQVTLEAQGIRSGLTLLNLVRGHLDFGQTDVASVTVAELRFLKEGDTNVQRTITGRPPDRADADRPMQLPPFRGRIEVASFAGPIILPDLPQLGDAPRDVYLDSGTLRIDAPDFGQPITGALQLEFRYGGDVPGTLAAGGRLDPAATDPLAMLQQLDLDLNHPQAEALWAIFEPMLADAAGELPPPRITRGALAFTLSITPAGQHSHITAATVLSNLDVVRGEQVILEDNRLEIRQDMQLDLANKSLSIAEMLIDLRRGSTAAGGQVPNASAEAPDAAGETPDIAAVLRLAITGGISDYTTRRNLDNVEIVADYNLAPLVELLRPFLPEAVREAHLAGRAERPFTVAGSLPADLEFADALRHVIIDGSLLVPEVEHFGMYITGLDLPIRVQDLIVRIIGAPPAQANDGTLQIPDLAIDLRGDVPLLTAAEAQLLENVSINPVVADTLLGPYFNPMFLDPEQAGGRLNVRLIAADNLPLGEMMFEAVPANLGRAELTLSLHDVNIGSRTLGRFLARPHVQGHIPEARVHLERGRLRHEMAMQIERYAVGFSGDMRLSDLYYTRLDVSVPRDQLPGFLRDQLPGDVQRLLPEQLTLPFSGPATNLRLSPDFVPGLAEQAIQRGLLERIPLPGPREPRDDEEEEQPPADPLREMMQRLLDRQRR